MEHERRDRKKEADWERGRDIGRDGGREELPALARFAHGCRVRAPSPEPPPSPPTAFSFLAILRSLSLRPCFSPRLPPLITDLFLATSSKILPAPCFLPHSPSGYYKPAVAHRWRETTTATRSPHNRAFPVLTAPEGS